MDPAIWSELPYDLLESIASFADIDTRRALGFKPRKLAQKCKLSKYLGGDMYSGWLYEKWGFINLMGYEYEYSLRRRERDIHEEERPLWLKDIEG